MHRESAHELELIAFAPRGEMAVVADTDDVVDDQAPDTIPVPKSIPLVPHVRVATGRFVVATKRERSHDEESAPSSVF